MFDIRREQRVQWLFSEFVRPYVFVRPENRVPQAGSFHKLDWFTHQQPLFKHPLHMDELGFANDILFLEEKAFGPKNLQMPRWVFYDCALVPGFVAGFAVKTEKLPTAVRSLLTKNSGNEWTPISLFIIIPTIAPGEWVAHNLCSINSILPKEHQYYGLGFLSKCFGLWYANVETCCGITQWKSPALRLHAQYGEFEVLTAFTPVHDFPPTLTYRLTVDPEVWHQFFTKPTSIPPDPKLTSSGFSVDPKDDQSLIKLQRRLEEGHHKYFLDSLELLTKPLGDKLSVYQLR